MEILTTHSTKSNKRVLHVALAGTLALALGACGGEQATPSAASSSITAVTTTPTPTSPTTPTPPPTTTPPPTATVSAELIAALNASLDDERKAEATYVAVMDKFGPVAPFSNIIEAERKHAAMVIDLFEDRKLDVPANSWLGQGKAEETLVANCVVGITAEEENIEMYDRLIATLSPDDEDVKQVFLALQAASRDKHLPAFKQCAGVI